MTSNETPSNIESQSTVTTALKRSAAVESTPPSRTAARAIAQQIPGVNMVSDEIAQP